jgi:thymidylate synthase
MMRILAAVQGEYGKRIVKHLKEYSPDDWEIETVTLPPRLPMVIDEPEDFLPSNISEAELLLAMIESDGAAQLVPALAKACGAKAVIVPVDDSSWLPSGLQNQIEQEMARDGVTAVFPKTFCTLTENGSGYRGKASSYSNELIATFGSNFGMPKLRIELDEKGEKIKSVVVERGSPCGSTHHASEKLVGMAVGEVVPRAGLIVHQFPCLASMQQEEIDNGVMEYLMAISGYVMNEEVERALKSEG